MIHTHAPHAGARFTHIPRRGQRLAALAALLLGARLLVEVMVTAGPLHFTAPTTEPSLERVTSVVRQHAGEWQPLTDPLVTVAEGVQVKSSNVYGVEIDNVRYYYHFTHGFSFDPVARGDVEKYSVVTVLNPGGPFETEVYRLD